MFHPANAVPRVALWLLLVTAIALTLGLNPEWRDATLWRQSLAALGGWLVPGVLLLQWLFALLMIPTLPVVAALAFLLPQQPLAAFALAMVGVLGSALLIYRAASQIGLTCLAHQSERLQPARRWIARHGSWALALWCLAPFLPSDAACYVAASARMPLGRFLLAVLAGEAVLCASIVYTVAGISG